MCTNPLSGDDEAPNLLRAELHQKGFYGLFFHPRLLDLAEKMLDGKVLLWAHLSFT